MIKVKSFHLHPNKTCRRKGGLSFWFSCGKHLVLVQCAAKPRSRRQHTGAEGGAGLSSRLNLIYDGNNFTLKWITEPATSSSIGGLGFASSSDHWGLTITRNLVWKLGSFDELGNKFPYTQQKLCTACIFNKTKYSMQALTLMLRVLREREAWKSEPKSSKFEVQTLNWKKLKPKK